jgi:hypothetical protein
MLTRRQITAPSGARTSSNASTPAEVTSGRNYLVFDEAKDWWKSP